MSGGSSKSPYYQKDPQIKKKKSKSANNKRRHSICSRKEVDPEAVRRLYFDGKLTQAQIAKKLGVSPTTIRRIFEDNGWVAIRPQYTDEDIRRLYFHDRLTKSEIARRLGISLGALYRAFERNRWETLPKQWPTKSDPEKARKLYEKGLPLAEIAKNLGVSVSTVRTYLRSTGAKRRVRPPYESDAERQRAKKEQSRKRQKKIHDLRDKLFGTECKVCGATKKKRKLAIHRKDFTEHNVNALWRLSFLRKVNPEEWSALCTMCHRGVHWANNDLGLDWKSIEEKTKRGLSGEFERKASEKKLKREPKSLSDSEKELTDLGGGVDEIRKALFGDECHFCGPIPEEKKLVIHRKDGRPHRRDALWSEKRLLRMDPDEWQALCQKHHRYVHWGMRHLGLKWEDIEAAFQKNETE